MGNRMFEMYEYRQIISRMKLGESDRAIDNAVLIVGPCGTGKSHIAQAIDRLRHGACRIVLKGKSFRQPKPLLKTSELPLAKGTKKR